MLIWVNPPDYNEANYVFEYLLYPLRTFLGNLLVSFNFEV